MVVGSSPSRPNIFQWMYSGHMVYTLFRPSVSGKLTTSEIGKSEDEFGLSQLFFAFDLQQITVGENLARIIREVTGSFLDRTAIEAKGKIFYPGQQSWLRRQENEMRGIPVDRDTGA